MAIDRSGAMQTLKISPGAYEAPRLSPDGTFVAFELAEGSERNIWIYNLSGASSMRRLTFGGSDRFPVWSADGRRVTYQSTRDGDSAIYWQLADGTGPAERLTRPKAGEAHVPDACVIPRRGLVVPEHAHESLWHARAPSKHLALPV